MGEFQAKSLCWSKRTQSLGSHLPRKHSLMPRLLAKYSVLSHITWTTLIKRSFKTAITASESRFEPLTCGQHAKGKSHKGSRCATCVCLGLEDMDKDKKEPKNQINANAVVTWQQWPCRFVWAGVGCHEGFRRKRRNERPERELEVQKFTPPLTPPGVSQRVCLWADFIVRASILPPAGEKKSCSARIHRWPESEEENWTQ